MQVFSRRNFQCSSLKVRGSVRFKVMPTSRFKMLWVKLCCDTVVLGNRSPSACWLGAVCYGLQTVGVSSEVAGNDLRRFRFLVIFAGILVPFCRQVGFRVAFKAVGFQRT